jgi:hypothetical protein|tara:strand:- start:1522 stop:2154 length:633 start_codon:yes stop_codon:yes gene_type:complete
MTETNYFDLIEYIAKIKSNNNKSIWKLNNNYLYNKFTQYVELNDELVEEELKKEKNLIVENEKKVDNKININKEIENDIQNDIQNEIENENITNLSQNKKKLMKSTNLEIKNKIKKQLPLELICNQLNLIISENTYNYIKTKITNNLEDKKYIKVFGVKKTAEIVSGIVNNKWNISLVLFMSFLLDKKFIYLKKEILYNKELESYDTITI